MPLTWVPIPRHWTTSTSSPKGSHGRERVASGRMPDPSNAIGSGSSIVGWGYAQGFLSGYTEVDSTGGVLADVRFPNGEVNYRAIKVDTAQVNLPLLRQTAGWTGATIPPAAPGGGEHGWDAECRLAQQADRRHGRQSRRGRLLAGGQ